jgi:thiamine pyrophosphate-dependent acetolactate synthase large subunit-like protein
MEGSDDDRRRRQARRGSLSEALAADTIVRGDSGTVAVFVARQIKLRPGQQVSFSGTNCSMAAAESALYG